jgi:hypothetical protein
VKGSGEVIRRGMKKPNISKSLGNLPPLTTPIADAASPTNPELSPPAGDPASEDFREMLRQRATAPLASVIPYHRWGLNE